jgi:hypothetical protein
MTPPRDAGAPAPQDRGETQGAEMTTYLVEMRQQSNREVVVEAADARSAAVEAYRRWIFDEPMVEDSELIQSIKVSDDEEAEPALWIAGRDVDGLMDDDMAGQAQAKSTLNIDAAKQRRKARRP